MENQQVTQDTYSMSMAELMEQRRILGNDSNATRGPASTDMFTSIPTTNGVAVSLTPNLDTNPSHTQNGKCCKFRISFEED